jgi:hypothetical protein
MTFKEIIGCSSKLLRNFSKKKKDQHRKLKRLNISIGNSFPQHRQIENFENSGQRNNSLYPPSIMTMSDLSRSISNRSITFASVFDEPPDNCTVRIIQFIDISFLLRLLILIYHWKMKILLLLYPIKMFPMNR